jgi:alkylation response protein AidB-like acyl-CoA dehydrogenase
MLRRMDDLDDTNNTLTDSAVRLRLKACAQHFAETQIAPRTDLRDHSTMPADLWHAVGEAGLAKIALPKEYGGAGGDLRALVMAAEAMAEAGGNLGMVTSWMGRQLISRLHILGHGTKAQRETYLPDLAAGRITPCLAISEPGAGAHPKHLTTTADRDGDTFILNGEKAYLTNGPIADIFLVLSITGAEAGRKQFSVLIAPRDSHGLELTEGVKIDFLHPSPHCGLKLHNVRVPAGNLLGSEGDAFEAISLPMRRTEDAVFAASKAGAVRHILRTISREFGDWAEDIEVLTELGKLSAACDGLGALAFHGAELLDIDPVANADTVSALAASAREWAGSLSKRIQALIERGGSAPSPSLAAACRDFEKSLGIARAAYAIQARRRGLALFEQKTETRNQ